METERRHCLGGLAFGVGAVAAGRALGAEGGGRAAEGADRLRAIRLTMSASLPAVAGAALLLCGTVIQALAGIGTDQPRTAGELQSADAPLTGNRVDLALADDWGTVGIDPNVVLSVDPVEGGAEAACRVVWRDGQALVRGSVSRTRERLGLGPARATSP